MKIRKCTEADVTAVGAFYDKVVLWLDARVNYPKWIYKEYPSEISVRDMTSRGEQYMCTEGDKIIAAFVLNKDPQGNYDRGNWKQSLPPGSYMVTHALAVEPELHGKGIASGIIAFCAEKAKSEGCEALRADIVPTNYPARRFHEKYGFTYAGDADLERGFEEIPLFSLYELDLRSKDE